jgi:flagellar hook-associated protein 2
MTRSTNAVDDVLENVQLQLLRETGEEPVHVTIGANTSATVAAVESFVGAYNRVVEFINAHQSFDSDAEKGGLFFGSPAIMSFESALRDQVSGLVGNLGGELKLASQIGLSFDSHDVLSLDRSKLLSALASDPEGVRRLFGVRSDAQGDGVQVVGSTSATRDSAPYSPGASPPTRS